MLRELDADASQQVFRAMMDAFARPGTIHRMPAGVLPPPVPAALAPLLALTDLMAPIAALESGAEPTADAVGAVARLTGARVAEDPAHTRFALALAEPVDWSSLNRGSHWSPEHGATLVQRVASLAHADAPARAGWLLTGPGVPPQAPVALVVEGVSDAWVAQRAELVSDYPAGVDVLLVTDAGDIAGLSRTTVVRPIEAEEN
jgi:alpha-D-ribose 1-methylphosphonate 5-triphosphate synthase subunit PhnH